MPKTQAMNATNEANGNYAATPKSNEIHSGVGVLDKTVKILDALESGPATLGQLVSATGLARPTAHRLAIALERHRFVCVTSTVVSCSARDSRNLRPQPARTAC